MAVISLDERIKAFESSGTRYKILYSEPAEVADVFNNANHTTFVINKNDELHAVYLRNLNRTLPKCALDFSDTPSLEIVYIYYCCCQIDIILDNLPIIRDLRIWNCGLRQLPDGLRKQTKLETLCVTDAFLETLPEWMQNLIGLTRLDLSSNQLTELPEWMQNLTGLTRLDLSSNQLTELPEWMQNLTGLTQLNLGGNNFTELPEWMQNLTGLTWLNLSDNQLTELPEWMRNLTELSWLDLRWNHLTELPEWMQNLTGLTWLYLGLNKLTELPEWMQNLTGLTWLDLCNNQLTELPEWMQNLTGLTRLYLGGNNFTELPEWMQNLTGLTQLDLRSNKLTELPEWLQNLTGLTQLDLIDNQLTELPEWMQNLTRLTELYLNYNRLTELPEWMQNLTGLTRLDLSNNQLTELPEWMQNLTGLTELYSNYNRLTELPEWMQNLTGLTRLDLSNNQLTELPEWMQNLTGLTELYLNYNRLTELPEWMKNLTGLTWLYLGLNKLTELPEWMQNLTGLTQLDLHSNKLTELPEWLQNLADLNYLNVSHNDINTLPTELGNLKSMKCFDISNLCLDQIPYSIISLRLPFEFERHVRYGIVLIDTVLSQMDINLFSQSRDVIEAFYADEQILLRECKVVFLGDGETGKSSLIQRMIDGTFDPKKNTTEGISIRRWSPDKLDGTIRFWDFGGQEIMHCMHRCFLTDRSVYVVVLNARENEFIDRKAIYWLDTVESFSKDTPVIIVINKMDLSRYASLNETSLRAIYPNIVNIIKTSALENDGVKRLEQEILDCVKKSEGYTHSFSVKFKKIKGQLEDMKRPYIDYDEYVKICMDALITERNVQNELLKWFKDLGVSFYYKDNPDREQHPSMERYTVLNPNWLTNGIYRIINRIPSDNGMIAHHIIADELSKSYPNDVDPGITYKDFEVEYILYVMRLFHLSYKTRTRQRDYEFIPLKCSKNAPESSIGYKTTDCLHLSWESQYIPFNLLYRVMLQMFHDIDMKHLWKYGAIFVSQDKSSSALLEISLDETSIDIYVKSSHNEAKEYLSRFRDLILLALIEFGITAGEYIHRTAKNDVKGKMKYTSVLKQYHDRRSDIYFDETDEYYKPEELLNLFYTSERIFNRYQEGMHMKNPTIININGDNHGSVTAQGEGTQTVSSDQTTYNTIPQSITPEQYTELQAFLRGFLESNNKEQQSLSRKEKKDLKKITKEKSHATGWILFTSILTSGANAAKIIESLGKFAQTNPAVVDWIRNALIFLISKMS